jgi:flagellar hook-associated protein 2
MSSLTRVTGLVSGMDTDATVKKLMAAQSIPLDKLKQKKQTLEWQQASYRAINNKILEFKNLSFDMKLNSNYSAKKTTSNNDTIATATATSAATEGIYEVEVQQVAKGSKLTSNANIGASSVSSTIQNIREAGQGGAGPAVPDATLLQISGEKGTSSIVVNKTDSLSTFVSNFNSKSSYTGVRVSYDSNMDRFFFTSTNTGANTKVELNATNMADPTVPDTGFLSNVLHLSINSSNKTGETVTGAAFMTTPALVPDTTKFVDAGIPTSETMRISYKGKDYDFAISNTTTLDTLIGSINASGLGGAGITSGLDSNGKLTFMGIETGKTISFSDQSAGGTDILASVGLPSVATAGPTVAGTVAFTKQPPDFVDTNKIIAPGLAANETFKMNYDGKDYEFQITSSTTIGSLIDQINTSDMGKKGVTARLDGTTGKLIVSSPDNTKHISFDDADSNASTGVLSALGLTVGVNAATNFNYDQSKDVGQDAIILFNGAQGNYASNTMTVAGISITAKSAAIGTKVTVNVTQDTDTVYDKIKSFVDKYNELITALNTTTSESKNRDYAPLTDAQRTGMTADQITAWETNAKLGLLHNDSILNNGVSQFRKALTDNIGGLAPGQVQGLWQIGISNTNISGGSVTGDYADNGMMYIDETKLRAAIAENPDDVMALFNSDDKNSATSAGDGVAVRLFDRASALFTQITQKAGVQNSVTSTYLIGQDMTRVNADILSWTTRLQDMETKYYNQFSTMETYLSKMNSQSSWLTQQTGGQ